MFKLEYFGKFMSLPNPCKYYIYVMIATREVDVSPRWRYASEDVNLYSRNSAHGHQPKGGRSCADGVRSTQDNTHGMCRRVLGCQCSGRRSQ